MSRQLAATAATLDCDERTLRRIIPSAALPVRMRGVAERTKLGTLDFSESRFAI
jgi:hypothetical protein